MVKINKVLLRRYVVCIASVILLVLVGFNSKVLADADPAFTFYGYLEIVPNPNPAIAGENTHFTVTVSNLGDAPATNVVVQLSYNDWGVTFMGWQTIGTDTIASIAPSGTGIAEFDHVFENASHTCIEALITSSDQDGNPNNNRGQINMEVVNAGGSFGYNVPIVNNGGGDLLLQVVGKCIADDPRGINVEVRCEPVDEHVLVPAGEEVLFPVHIAFPPGTPCGTAVDFILLAVDLQNPGNMNHVVLRVVFNTPRCLKQESLNRLGALQPGPIMPRTKGFWGSVVKRVNEIKGHIESSLEPSLWVDDFHLAPNAGGQVYAQEMVSAIQLLQLVQNENLPLNWKTELDACARLLTDAERILAQTAIQDAGGDADAEDLLQEGDEWRLNGDYPDAIRTYGHIPITIRVPHL